MANTYEVVGIGCCAFDLVTQVERYPGPDEKMGVSLLEAQGGGLVATALVAVARLGGRCAYLGPLGDDYFSQFCVNEFDREGVDTSYIRRVEGASVLKAVIVACPATGTRMILNTLEDNPRGTPEDVPEEVIAQTRVLHVDNFQPLAARAGAALARRLGVPITMDLEAGGADPDDLLPLADYPIVPEQFVRDRYGVDTAEQGARALFEEVQPHGGEAGIVTCGDSGSWAACAKAAIHQPAYRAPVVDTTGCGDVYHGAFALALSRGWELQRIMSYASAVAALKCRERGGRAGIPAEEEVREFLGGAEPLPCGTD